MYLTSSILCDQQQIPVEYTFGISNPQQHVTLGPNRNPPFKWSALPTSTSSLVLICDDPDVPICKDDVNKEDRQIPSNVPRSNFYHWILVDLAPELQQIMAGEFSDGITPNGKLGPNSIHGTRQGINNYREWFANDSMMRGKYFGYDGPCPPWNDTIPHRYIFTLYALDVERCPVEGDFTGPDVLAEIAGHVIDQAKLTVTYSLNPIVSANLIKRCSK